MPGLEPSGLKKRFRKIVTCILVPALTGIAMMAFAIGPAEADKRVALVIGNSAYQNVNPLPNPAKDAAAIGDMFRKAGFDVVDAKTNVNNADMRQMVRDFTDKVTDADIAVVYYAGHGIEIDGTNYLLPIDTKLQRDTDVDDEAISLDRVVRTLDPAKKLRLVILDACRDNPFSKTMKRSLSRGVERGLAKVEPSNPNTLIAYAAKAGSTASDGSGDHSPFAVALLQQLATPGQDVRRSFGFVRDEVMQATGNKQEPFVYGSLGGADVVLVPGAAKPAVPVPPQASGASDPAAALRVDYELAAQVNTKPAWDAFLASHPTGFFADLARAARGKLDASPGQVASVDSRTATPTAPAPVSKPAVGPIASYVGKSFRLNYVERQVEDGTDRITTPGREVVIFVNNENETSTRLTQLPGNPMRISSRFAHAALGGTDRGVQVTFDQGLHLTALAGGGSYHVKVDIVANGNTCRGNVSFELVPGKQFYEMHRISNGEPINMKLVGADRLTCAIIASDLSGPPTIASMGPNGPGNFPIDGLPPRRRR